MATSPLAIRAGSTNRMLLLGAVAVPFHYYGTMLAASALYPGYSHSTQYASELGSASAAYPAIFNTGAVLGGIAGILGGIGVFRALRELGRGWLVPGLVALAIIGQATGFVFAGVFPMLVVDAVLIVAMFAVMMGVGEPVTSRNAGIVQRINSLTNIRGLASSAGCCCGGPGGRIAQVSPDKWCRSAGAMV